MKKIIQRLVILENRLSTIDRLQYISNESWQKKKKWTICYNKTLRKVKILRNLLSC